jgi:ATP-dependent RNA helicase RhlE
MLDMGFIHDVKKIVARIPAKRQTIFFSATMPSEISKLADTILTNPVRVEVTPVSSTANTVKQELYFVEKNNKRLLLLHLLKDDVINTALVFTRTKHGADRVAKDLNRAGIIAEAIHGNKSQNARQRALSNFKSQQTRVLVATDIAARGIDIDELSHVINYELPNIPETYVHRIGRTGRAGASGISISFCDGEEKAYLKDIQKLIGKSVPVAENNPYPMNDTSMDRISAPPKSQNQNRSQGQRRSGGFKSGGFKRSSSSNATSASSSSSRNSNSSSTSRNSNSASSARRPSRDWKSMSSEKNY